MRRRMRDSEGLPGISAGPASPPAVMEARESSLRFDSG